jgi:hypothetical protein
VITVYVIGVQTLQVTDHTYPGGSPGMGFCLQEGASGNDDYGFTSLEAVTSTLQLNCSQAPQTALSPGPARFSVRSLPSRTSNNPGKFLSHGRFAAGTYSRAFDSSVSIWETCAAMPAE